MSFPKAGCPGLPALILSLACGAHALLLDSTFSDNMVLQRERTITVTGRATPGEKIDIAFNGQTATAAADAEGKWKIPLNPMQAGGPYAFAVKGLDTSIAIKNVLMGDVWLCSGQSNMQFTVNRDTVFKAADSMQAVNLPEIRQCDALSKKWISAVPSSVGQFTAAGFFTLREAYQATKVPMGILLAAAGGSVIETWMPPGGPGAYSNAYNRYIVPWQGYPIKGALWYQGESNRAGMPERYGAQLTALINGWRQAWKQGDFPFFWVQLPNYLQAQADPNVKSGLALVREGQRLNLALPNTGMAVTIDIGDSADIHPANKRDVGLRLSRPVLAKVYGRSLEISGPLYEALKIEGARIRLRFSHATGGMVAKGGKLEGFAIAGADSVFRLADAVIEGLDIVVSQASVPAPTQVRYAWADYPVCNLYNGEGLPASPFRTSGPQLPAALVTKLDPMRSLPVPGSDIRLQGFDVLGRIPVRPSRLEKSGLEIGKRP